jgi:transcriptional regulator with XRE-family HTH domain
MSIALNIQTFLNCKIQELKITRQDFIKGSGIPASVVSGFINAIRINPTLNNVIKIADYFHCSVDEILGRTKYILHNKKVKQIPYSEIVNNLLLYLRHELKIRNLSANELAYLCKIGENTILKSLSNNKKKGNLSTRSIVAIADYLDISIDKMIGRI